MKFVEFKSKDNLRRAYIQDSIPKGKYHIYQSANYNENNFQYNIRHTQSRKIKLENGLPFTTK